MASVIESIRMFRALTGASCCYHDSTGAVIPVLGRPLRFHTHAFCRKIKAKHEGRCVHTDSDRVSATIERYPDGFWKRCHAGAVEYVHSLGTRGVLFFGPFRPGKHPAYGIDDFRGGAAHPSSLPLLADHRSVAALASLIARDVLRELPALNDADNDRRRAVERFFSQRYRDDVRASDCAAAVGVSVPRLRQLLAAWYGKPYTHIIAEQRIREASRMLIATEKSIRDIARMSGFPDADYFFKVFKRYTGTTPRAYREMNSVHRGRKRSGK